MILNEVGKYKVAYMNRNDSSMLYSKMFDDYDSAISYVNSFPKNSDVLLFENTKSDADEYAWKVVPNIGNYNNFKLGIYISNNKNLIFSVAALILTITIIKLIKIN